ncbi:hypothetical protein U1Q18_026284 [Sarracenia purpurea var. burkii]
MAVSLNSVSVFNSSGKYFNVPRSGIGASFFKASHWIGGLRRSTKDKKRGLCLLVADSDRVATDAISKGSGNAEGSDSDDQSSAPTLPSLGSPIRISGFQTESGPELGPPTPEDGNGSAFSSNPKQNPSSVNVKPGTKRSSLTAREKLRAARVLSRYTESKASKPEFGSNVLEALRESDRGKKKSGLPEAPTNLFDDSKRGMPKQGLTFDFPGGFDAFVIIVSFVTISSLMFATTYFVWKVGAIHFNEY